MKNLTVFLFVLCIVFSINAQEEGRFRFNVGVGYAYPTSGGGGVAFQAETQYNISENMNVGVMSGFATLIKNIDVNGEEFKALDATVIGSYYGTFNYYFNAGSAFAPFAGFGMGIVTLPGVKISESSIQGQLGSQTKFGGMIRAGFEYGKFITSFQYNLVPKSNYKTFTSDTGGTTDVSGVESKNSYFSIGVGVFLGGGKWGQ